MPDEFKHLNKEDLFLLMESYRNMITMHSTLVEQQKQIIDRQNIIINKQDGITLKQNKSCDELKSISSQLSECTNNLLKTHDIIQSSSNNIDKTITSSLDVVKDRISEGKLDLTKQHSGINTRIYVSMGAMATIIIGLIGLSMGLADKYDILIHLHDIVNKIAEHIIPHAH